MMEAHFAASPSWLDVVAFDTEVAKDAKPEDVVFVDVGGGNGLQCAALKKAFPDLKGRIIIQDRHAVLEKTLQTDGVETMTHDILTEQPVKNARAYYFHQILQNYDDETCIHILQMHLPALYRNTDSRLYINEKVMPDEKSDISSLESEHSVAHSLPAVALPDAQVRHEAKWRWLLDQAGMEVVEIRRYSSHHDSVVISKRRFQDEWR